METLLLQSAGRGTEWPDAMIALGGIAMVTIIVAVVVWQLLASWRARMSLAREDAYQKLAEESAQMQKTMADDQRRMAEQLDSVNTRLASIERILQQVE